jgi:hypothetical protein
MTQKPPYFTRDGVEIFAEDFMLAALWWDEQCRDLRPHGNCKGRPAPLSLLVGRWLAGETFVSIARSLTVGGETVRRRILTNSRRAERRARGGVGSITETEWRISWKRTATT